MMAETCDDLGIPLLDLCPLLAAVPIGVQRGTCGTLRCGGMSSTIGLGEGHNGLVMEAILAEPRD